MESANQQPVRKCCRCGDELLDGMQYCVACGTQNSDPAAAFLATSELERQSDARKASMQRRGGLGRWLRIFLRG